MSVCTFIASDHPMLSIVGGIDENFSLLPFHNVADYTNRKYGVYLEWDYTDERAEQILEYIKEVLKKTEVVELWHVWLMDYYEYEYSPVIQRRTIPMKDMTTDHIKEINEADIWNKPDKYMPSRPSFYCLRITT